MTQQENGNSLIPVKSGMLSKHKFLKINIWLTLNICNVELLYIKYTRLKGKVYVRAYKQTGLKECCWQNLITTLVFFY